MLFWFLLLSFYWTKKKSLQIFHAQGEALEWKNVKMVVVKETAIKKDGEKDLFLTKK